MEQSGSFSGDLILKGYSPTILLENGAHLTSFYKKKLNEIVEQLTKAVSSNNVSVCVTNQYKKEITYISQYRESNFHFLNRLSSEFNEWFFYDGTDLHFGKPSSSKNIDVAYGGDINSIQITLRILPMNFSNYSYNSKEDKVLNFNAPAQVDGLNEYAGYVLKESNKVFSEPVNLPLRQRVESKSDLESFVKKQKAAIAAELEVLSGTSDNPAIGIGVIANVKISKLEDGSYKKEDYGKFLITSVEHYVGDNGKYYNVFEAIPSGLETIPVKNVVMPVAEPQIAIVKDNKDPDNMGRVRVQMLWQKDNELTDWLRVMTPDAGGGKAGAKNRGLVVVPEAGDQVLISFRYNDPDRPFVMGSMFHGKTGGGGGSGNKSKSLTSLSGSVVSLNGDAISIVDAAGNKIKLDGSGNITINCSASITLECGGSKITMESGGKIEIIGTEIMVHGSSKAVMKSTADFTAEGTKASVHGATTEIKGDTSVDVKSDTKVEIGSPSTTVEGTANLKLKSPGIVDVEGGAMTNVKGGMVNLN